MKEAHIEFAKRKYTDVSNFLEGKQYLMGNKITIADFAMFEAICWHIELDTNMFDDLVPILDFYHHVNSISQLKPLLKGGDQYCSAIFAPTAYWGNV